MWLFQKVMLIQNPEPYLMQRGDSDSAIVMKNATLSWTTTHSSPSSANGVNAHKVDKICESEKSEALPALRNISFTLHKVCFTTDKNIQFIGKIGLC